MWQCGTLSSYFYSSYSGYPIWVKVKAFLYFEFWRIVLHRFVLNDSNSFVFWPANMPVYSLNIEPFQLCRRKVRMRKVNESTNCKEVRESVWRGFIRDFLQNLSKFSNLILAAAQVFLLSKSNGYSYFIGKNIFSTNWVINETTDFQFLTSQEAKKNFSSSRYFSW